MKTIETQYQYIFRSADSNGAFEIRIHKDCRQIQMESGIGSYSNEVFVDVDLSEIKAIRDMLNELIEQ